MYSINLTALLFVSTRVVEAELVVPLMLVSLVLTLITFIPNRTNWIYGITGAFVLLTVIFHVVPVPAGNYSQPWVAFLRDTQIFNILIGTAFIYKIIVCLSLYRRTQDRYLENTRVAKEHVDRYHNLFENSLEAMLVIDEASGKILDVNRSARELFGYGSEELGEIGIEDLFMTPPQPSADVDEYEMRHMIRKRNGEGVYVEFGNFPVSDRSDECTVLSLRNIHHRVLAERQLTVNWQRYQRIFDTNALGIQETDLSAIVADLNDLRVQGVTDLEAYIEQNPVVLQEWLGKTQIKDLNNALLALTKAPTKQYFLENLDLFLTEQAFHSFAAETLAIWNGAKRYKGEIVIRDLNGDMLTLEYSTIFPEDGDYSHLVYTYVDVTATRQHRATIQQQVTMLNEKTEMLERYIESNMQLENFAYVASHDLQTPLRAITGFSQILQSEVADRLTKEELSYLDHIITATGNMNKLIEALLAYSRVNTVETQWKEISPKALLDTVLSDVRPELEDRKALVQIGDLPGVVLGDETRLRQLFQNLFTNALKFSRENVVPLIQVSSEVTDKHWHFSVADNGIGIEPEFQERIFLLFQKLHSPQEYAGTGIGLSICKKIVEQHGGEIWLESDMEKGTTFHFTLALQPDILDHKLIEPVEAIVEEPLTDSVH